LRLMDPEHDFSFVIKNPPTKWLQI
jgi:hypothetical protein